MSFVQRSMEFIAELEQCSKGYNLLLTTVNTDKVDESTLSLGMPVLIKFSRSFYIYFNQQLIALDKKILGFTVEATHLLFPPVGKFFFLSFHPRYHLIYKEIASKSQITYNALLETDRQFLEKFNQIKETHPIPSESNECASWWLLHFFKPRCEKTLDNIDNNIDATFHLVGSSKLAIKFAFDVSRVCGKNYLEILLGIENSFDPRHLTPLINAGDCLYIPSSIKNPNLKSNQYIYLENEENFYYIFQDNEPELLEINDVAKSHFINCFKSYFTNKSTQIMPGKIFHKLLLEHEGCYPYFELRNFFRDYTGKFLHCWEGENDRISSALVTYDNYRDIRVLTLIELWRLRSKRGEFLIEMNGKKSSTIWSMILNEQIPQWKNTGTYPYHLIPPILSLLNIYFLAIEKDAQEPNLTYFREQLLIWSEKFVGVKPDDARFLYGQELLLENGKIVYLIEILMDCLDNYHPDLDKKMLMVAKWLCLYDASFVCASNLVAPLYKQLSAGSYFKLEHLKEVLKILDVSQSEEIANKKRALELALEGRNKIDAIIINNIINLYQDRANIIPQTQLNYQEFRSSGSNKHWIRLLQLLAGAGHLPVNYNAVLMPSHSPLTLEKLSGIRKKNNLLYFDIANQTYENFCYYSLDRNSVPALQKNAELPQHLFTDLMDLINSIYEYRSDPTALDKMRYNFKNLSIAIKQCAAESIDDVVLFYIQKIRVDEGYTYLADILLNLMECLKNQSVIISNELSDHIDGLVCWLGQYDPSLIIKHNALAPLYRTLGVGPGFGPSQLENILKEIRTLNNTHILQRYKYIDNGKLSLINDEINCLIESVRQNNIIKLEMINSLRNLAKTYWKIVKGEKIDHIQHPLGMTSPWVRLAQSLFGAGFLEAPVHLTGDAKALYENYYVFLMPTLNHFMSDLMGAPITSYPLSHYVLKEINPEEDEIILLDPSVYHFKSTKVFRDCRVHPPQKFSDKVLERIKAGHKRFNYYPSLEKAINENQPLSVFDYLIFKNFLDKGLYANGLYVGGNYTEKQYDCAINAYENLCEQYKKRSPSQQNIINNNTVFVRGKIVTVSNILDEGWECVAIMSYRLAVLCKSYFNEATFSPDIEKILEEEEITPKTFGDRNFTIERIQLLLVELMSYSFSAAQDNVLKHFGCTNNLLPGVVECIFNHIAPMVEQNTYNNIFKNYIQMVEKIIKPYIANTQQILDAQLINWLKSILDESIYNEHGKIYSLQGLLSVLINIENKQQNVSEFFNCIIHIKLDEISVKKTIEINIIFRRWLRNQSREYIHLVYSGLNTYKDKELNLQLIFATYLMQQIIGLGYKANNELTFYNREAPLLSESIQGKIKNVSSLYDVIKIIKAKVNFGDKLSSVEHYLKCFDPQDFKTHYLSCSN